MTDFLLELRSEEIPARMQVKAKGDLARLFAEEIAKSGLKADSIETFATPRRLALIACGLPTETEATSEERKGPRANAPEQALAGFLRSTGLTREQLTERDGVFFAQIEKPGRATAEVLAEAVPVIIRAFPWPKSMRWGDASISTESLRWVRPLQGIVALFGEMIVPLDIDGPPGSPFEPDTKITSGATTLGHRFHHSGAITIGSADDYVEKLRMCHVIVHFSERCALIRNGAAKAAAAAGLTVIPDEALIIENAGLTEWPMPLLGRFDATFLELPREVIQLTMRTNQKYFACADADGKLANAFVCTANIDASDGGASVIAGNEKVLSARLSDAKFFWEADLKVPLAEQAKKLSQIVFHERLGTVADKVERVAKLARWLITENIVTPGSTRGPALSSNSSGTPDQVRGDEDVLALAALAERAAHLCKADLVTGMVGEFPELQGIMGGYYAAAQGEHPAVSAAIRDHYKPVGQGDDVPTDPVTVAVSLADKLDTLFSFFAIAERPTGSKDPFALRRSSLGILAMQIPHGLRWSVEGIYRGWSESSGHDWLAVADGLEPVRYFLADRLKVQQREAGVRHDLIDAVFALGGEDDLVRLLARVKALQAFVTTAEGANLLAGYKRAANILKKEAPTNQSRHPELVSGPTPQEVTPPPADAWMLKQVQHDDADGVPSLSNIPLSYTPEPCEAALIDALDTAEPSATASIAREDFEDAMAALAQLRAPIDAFFETVTVNDPDPAKRSARLALLSRVRDAVHRVADFSKIEG